VSEKEGNAAKSFVEIDRYRFQEPAVGPQVEVEPGHELTLLDSLPGQAVADLAGHAQETFRFGRSGLGQTRGRPDRARVESAGGLNGGLDEPALAFEVVLVQVPQPGVDSL